MYGLSIDTVRKGKYRTKTIQSGINPVFDEEPFLFRQVVMPQLAVLRIAAFEEGLNILLFKIIPPPIIINAQLCTDMNSVWLLISHYHLAVGVRSVVVMMLMHGENLLKKQTNTKFVHCNLESKNLSMHLRNHHTNSRQSSRVSDSLVSVR